MKKINAKLVLFFLIMGFLWVSNANSTTLNAADCSQSAVQTQVDAAKDGDVVLIPAGSCTWTTQVSWTNKNISVIGAGTDSTIITADAGAFGVTMTDYTKASWRISGMKITGSTSTQSVIGINSEYTKQYSYGWRIDHMIFDYSGANSKDPISIMGGPTFGLFDHDYFHFVNSTWIIVMGYNTALGEAAWRNSVLLAAGQYNMSLPLDLGTQKAIYFEDCTFEATTSYNAFFDTSSGGARVVFRYNEFIGGFLYAHWVRGTDICVFKVELYNNYFHGTSNWTSYPVRFEAGTGVIFNNTVTSPFASAWLVDDRRGCDHTADTSNLGICDGSKSWDGNAGDTAAPGWPCLGQIGRDYGKTMAQIEGGSKQGSAPMYAWNNGGEDGCRNGGTCTNTVTITTPSGCAAYIKSTAHAVNGQVDFVNGTAKPGYRPYTYPHPLTQAGADTSPSPPRGLRIIQ